MPRDFHQNFTSTNYNKVHMYTKFGSLISISSRATAATKFVETNFFTKERRMSRKTLLGKNNIFREKKY